MSKFSGFAKFFMKNRFKTFKAIFSTDHFFSQGFGSRKSLQVRENSA